ncbi:hypothetical protein [Paenibacillus elgii]|uniref:hypothetical protein n=1 Tax=Paenibacillus elgii TaxID=189691 RepID=UPI000492A587|nr:hypothetical protein [Paenibacillus elgii]
MSIKIGDNNKISNSTIGHQHNPINENDKKKSFAERHPVIVSFIVSLVVGIILLFSFWKNVINWFEGLFM